MSKIGKKLIVIPSGVTVSIKDGLAVVTGPKGELKQAIHPKVQATVSGPELKVTVNNPEDRRQKALWGTMRSLLYNMIAGVTTGFERKLDIVGVGYKAAVSAGKLTLNLGYSHPIELPVPKGLEVKVEKNTISVAGSDNQVVGEFAAVIRSQRPPEPYKGKGIKYQNEIVRRKAGKVVKAVGAG
jgi:large subunit ribosomal protein L6